MALKKFNYQQDFEHLNFRQHPELYQVGKGEQGVLLVEPYKSEILPHWRFKTPEIAQESAQKIYNLFLTYFQKADFVGMDMARKFLQMGYTRARRYANHPSGQKYHTNPQLKQSKVEVKKARQALLPQAEDWKTSHKAEAARIFYGYYLKAREHSEYQKLKKAHQLQYEQEEAHGSRISASRR